MSNSASSKYLVLGTAQLGMPYGAFNKIGLPNGDEAAAIFQEAISEKIYQIDTARAYGDAEARLGRFLAGHGNANICVITKLDPLSFLPKDSSMQAVIDAVDQSVEESCQNLKMNVLPVLLLHRWEHRRFFGGSIWRRLLEHKRAGKILKLGASLYDASEALEALKDNDVKYIQLPFNLLDRRWAEKGVGQCALARPDVVIHVRSIFLQGLLIYSKPADTKFNHLKINQYLKAMDSMVKEFERESRADLCIAYVKAQNWFEGVVMGMESLEQLKENARLFKKPSLTQIQCQKVETVFTGLPDNLLNPSKWSLK